MNLNVDINLTEGQKAAYELCHDPKNKVVTLCYSRQCGKSVLCELMVIEYLCKTGTFNGYLTPSYQLGRKVMKEIVSLLEPAGVVKRANGSTLTIETIFGSTLQFFSAEAYRSIRGNTIDGILVVDEAAYMADELPNGENFWANVVLPVTKARKPLILMVSTPCGQKGFFFDYYNRGVNGWKGYASLKRTIYDDGLVSSEEIEELKKGISSLAFRQEFLCEFIEDASSFFQGFAKCFDTDKFSGGRCWIGIDLAGNGQDATIVTIVNERGEVRQEEVDGSLDSKYGKIAKIVNSIRPVAVYAENNGLGTPMINEIRKKLNGVKLIEWTTTNTSKEEIVSELAVAIAGGEVHFMTGETKLYSELQDFVVTVSKSRKLTFAARAGKHDDRVMSLAIALRCKKDCKHLGKNNNVFIKRFNRLFI